MSVGSASLDGVVEWSGWGAVLVLSTVLSGHWDQLWWAVSSINTVWRSATVEGVDGGGGGGEPAEEVSGARAVDVRGTLHWLEGESRDEWSRGGWAERLKLSRRSTAHVLIQQWRRVASVSIWTSSRHSSVSSWIRALHQTRSISILGNNSSWWTRLRETVVLTRFLRGKVVSISFTSIVLERLAGLGVGVEVPSGDSGAGATDSDVARLGAHEVLRWAAETLGLINGSGPCGDRGAVVGGWTLSVCGASTGGSILLLPHLSTIWT